MHLNLDLTNIAVLEPVAVKFPRKDGYSWVGIDTNRVTRF